MKLRVDLSIFLILFLLSSTLSSNSNYFPIMTKTNNSIVVENINTSSNSGRGGGGGSNYRVNTLEIVSVGHWGLTFMNPHLSFHANQLARDTSGNDVFLSSVITEPLGIVEAEVKDNFLYIYPKTLGETTVTAHIYSIKGHSVIHPFPITVKEFLPTIVKDVPEQYIISDKKIDYNIDFLVKLIPEAEIKINNVVADNNVLEVSFLEQQFSLLGKQSGKTMVTTTLTDKFNSFVDVSFPVTVTDSVYGE